MKTIKFYFDFLSPYSYFSWLNHQTELQQLKVNIQYKPILMGKLFSYHQFPGPGEIKVKRNYELKKCFRYANKNNIDFIPPSRFPFNPLGIIRLATACIHSSLEEQLHIIDFIFKQIWACGEVLEDPDHVKYLFQKHNINDVIIDKSYSKAAKFELKDNIKCAITEGVFGVPSFVVIEENCNELFWGNDSFHDLKGYLAGNDIWNKELYTKVLQNN